MSLSQIVQESCEQFNKFKNKCTCVNVKDKCSECPKFEDLADISAYYGDKYAAKIDEIIDYLASPQEEKEIIWTSDGCIKEHTYKEGCVHAVENPSPQPEEWRSSCCDEKLNLICVGCLQSNDIESFLKTEIRKAEERFVDRVVKMIEYEKSFDERGKDQFSKGAVKASENIIRRVEALKK